MTLLGPLWLLWAVVPLGVLCGLLWLYVLGLPEPLPLAEYERRLLRQPLTSRDIRPIVAMSAASASAITAASSYSVVQR